MLPDSAITLKFWMAILVGARVIFFLMVLCFGFGIRIMLITHWCCWALLTQHQSLLSFLCCLDTGCGGVQGTGGCIARTANENQSEWYSMPYDIMLSKKRTTAAWGLARHRSVCDRWCPVKLSLSPPMSFICFPVVSLMPLCGTVQMAAWCSAVC